MNRAVDIFIELGQRLSRGVPDSIVEAAVALNSWFSSDEIARAVEAIAGQMLRPEAVTEWVSGYGTIERSERVLVVMAGNIPLVGLFDLLCVVVSGHSAYVKPSHKDRVLMEWIIGELRDIESQIPIYIYSEGEPIDRVIATGGEGAVAHFSALYDGCKSLLRGSRSSVAVVSEGDLALLSDDIYSYSGLGCRNVSLLFVPAGFDLSQLPVPTRVNEKYMANYRQCRALLTMIGESFYDSGVSCFRYSDELPSQLSEISVVEYSSIDEVERWIAQHDEQLQCIVAQQGTIEHPRRVDVGCSQRPTLNDYADGVDTMLFLR